MGLQAGCVRTRSGAFGRGVAVYATVQAWFPGFLTRAGVVTLLALLLSVPLADGGRATQVRAEPFPDGSGPMVEAATATVRRPRWARPEWTTTALLATPYATQAAAADTRHVYAISSTAVAIFERTGLATVGPRLAGEPLARFRSAVTSSDTRHLNSGFVHDGRLYCAHSNYPLEPPESDIRVLDPHSERLDVFHTFIDPPGSLVWCVVRPEPGPASDRRSPARSAAGRWWCCFAHYGADNARTVLIEYADDGLERERRRFTFPGELVADWDGMSASGGLWDGDTLLVSHHHDPVLYRLALPEMGHELQLLATYPGPFPGQGIAVDPVTGGLVGIDRGHLRVVFAAPKCPE
jgi:hypothetical protein